MRVLELLRIKFFMFCCKWTAPCKSELLNELIFIVIIIIIIIIIIITIAIITIIIIVINSFVPVIFKLYSSTLHSYRIKQICICALLIYYLFPKFLVSDYDILFRYFC